MPNPSLFYTVVALGKESTYGTSVARNVFLPSDQPRFQPKALRHVLDTGFRGVPAAEFDLIPGPGEGTWQFNGNVFVDSTPHLLMGILGQDTISGTGPYTHTLKAAALPPSYSLEWQQNTQPFLLAGARVGQLTLNFNARDGALTYSVQGMSKLGATTPPTTPAFATTSSVPGWLGTVTIGGGAPSSLLEGSLTFQRQLRPIHALNNTQDVAAIWPGPLQVTGRLTFSFEAVTEYNYFATAGQTTLNAIVLTFSQGANASVAITLTKAAWRIVDIEPADTIYTAVAQINGVYNATDGGPAQVVVMNSVATAY